MSTDARRRTFGLSWALLIACTPSTALEESDAFADATTDTDDDEQTQTTAADDGDEQTQAGDGGDGIAPPPDLPDYPDVYPDPNPLTILPLGDSVTRGRNEFPSYRYFLGARLEQGGRDIDYVGTLHGAGGCCDTDASYDEALFPGFYDLDHEGHSALSANQARAKLQAWDGTETEPVELALVMLGVADANYGTPLELTMASMFDLVARLRELYPDVRVAIATPIPSNDPEQHARIDAIAQALPDLESLSELGREVILVDMHDGFDDETMLTVDGSHANAAGDAFIARRWFDTIADELPALGW